MKKHIYKYTDENTAQQDIENINEELGLQWTNVNAGTGARAPMSAKTTTVAKVKTHPTDNYPYILVSGVLEDYEHLMNYDSKEEATFPEPENV